MTDLPPEQKGENGGDEPGMDESHAKQHLCAGRSGEGLTYRKQLLILLRPKNQIDQFSAPSRNG